MFNIILYYIISYPNISYYIIPYYISYHIILYHTTSYQIILYHIKSNYIMYTLSQYKSNLLTSLPPNLTSSTFPILLYSSLTLLIDLCHDIYYIDRMESHSIHSFGMQPWLPSGESRLEMHLIHSH